MPEAVTDTASRSTLWSLATHWAGVRPTDDVIVSLPDPTDPGSLTRIDWERLVTETTELRRRLAAIGVLDQGAVLFAMPNSPLTVALWLAVIANGAVVQAMDEGSGVIPLERAIRQTRPVAAIVSSEVAPRLGEALGRVAARIPVIVPEDLTLSGGYERIAGLTTLGSEPEPSRPEDLVGLLPTSGTSGAPKLVELTNASYVMGAERLARNTGFLAVDRHYVCSPFFHTNAQVYLVAPPFVTGGSIGMVPRFSAGAWFSAARALGVTVASMVAPPMRLALRRAVEQDGGVDAGALRLIQYGMTMSAADWADWDRLVPDIHMRQIYGQTESITGVLGGSPWERDDRRTIGRPFIGVPGVRVVDDEGRDVPDGEPGELWVEGRPGSSLMRGYYGDPEATESALVDGRWLRTGDVMVRGTDGRFEFRGRRMHIIRRGGENISTYALEIDLQSCPLVADVAVTAQQDERLDALVVAHVVARQGYSEEIFRTWCRENLGRRGTPDVIRVHADFPRTPSGRVVVREL